MSNEVNQAYLRAYIKSRAEGAPVHPRQPASGNSPTNEAIRKPVTQRIDAGTQQVPGPSMPIPSRRVPAVPSQKEVLRSESAKTYQETQQSNVWSPLGAERGVKATGIFRSQPAVIVNGVASTRETSQVPEVPPQIHRSNAESVSIASAKHPSPMGVEKKPQTSPAAATRIRIDRAHVATPVDRSAPHVDRTTSAPTASPPSPQYRPVTEVSERATSAHYDSGLSALPEAFRPAAPYAPRVAPYIPAASYAPATASYAPVAAPHAAPLPRKQAPTLPPSQNRRLDPSPEPATIQKAPAQQARTPELRAPLPLPVTFTPSWEVDRFFWPEVAIHIEKAHGDAFQQIGKHLRIANQEGLRVIAITSGERGVGRSTVAMHLARSAAAAGLNVALVDTDTFYPSLVDQLRLDVEHGWQDCLFENIPLEETAVRSVEDGITVFPLTSTISSQQMHANLHRMSKIVKRIASAFDMVLLDSSRLNLEQRDLVGVSQESIVDAAIVVVDTELSIKEKVDTAVSILQGMGIASIGMVENFNG